MILVILLRFILLVAVQVLILNHLQLGSLWHPMIYILFVLTLPFNTPGWLLLLLSFCLGISIDMFTQTLGIHTTATVLTAYLRPSVLRLISTKDNEQMNITPDISDMGIKRFIYYASFLVFLHHLVLFYMEAFSLSGFYFTFLRAIFSFFFSMLLIIIAQLLFQRNKK